VAWHSPSTPSRYCRLVASRNGDCRATLPAPTEMRANLLSVGNSGRRHPRAYGNATSLSRSCLHFAAIPAPKEMPWSSLGHYDNQYRHPRAHGVAQRTLGNNETVEPPSTRPRDCPFEGSSSDHRAIAIHAQMKMPPISHLCHRSTCRHPRLHGTPRRPTSARTSWMPPSTPAQDCPACMETEDTLIAIHAATEMLRRIDSRKGATVRQPRAYGDARQYR